MLLYFFATDLPLFHGISLNLQELNAVTKALKSELRMGRNQRDHTGLIVAGVQFGLL